MGARVGSKVRIVGAFVERCNRCGIVFVSVYIDLMTGSQWWVSALGRLSGAMKFHGGLRAGRATPIPTQAADLSLTEASA
jgi:hypothetical protein